jgi:single-strand DNA-binding protein
MAVSINRVVLVGNLVRDPELKTTSGGTSVCRVRLAVNDRVKDSGADQWRDCANFFDVAVFGALADELPRYLAKGSQIGIEGRLHWREWQGADGQRHSAISVVADRVQFLGPKLNDTQRDRERDDAVETAAASDDDYPF